MGTGYVRVETYTTGDTIEAADTNNEFDALVNTFNSTTGHTHDGTAAEGGPISTLGPTQDITVSATEVLPKTDDTVDLGSATYKFKDIYIDGIAYLDKINGEVVDNIDGFETTAMNGDITYLLEYSTDSGLGGGTFAWDSSRNKTDHDGGIVIDPDIDMSTPTYTSANVGTGVWVRMNTKDRINVQWFGAVGDGSTDDSTAIQAALDNYTNYPIYFPDTGNGYVIGTTLTIYEEQSLIGDNFKGGKLSTIQTVTSAFSGDAMIQTNGFTTSDATTTNIDHVSIVGLNLDSKQSGIDCIRCSVRFATFYKNRFNSGVSGSDAIAIHLIGSDSETALNNTFSENYFTGRTGVSSGFQHHIYLHKDNSDNKIINNYFEGCFRSSVFCGGSVNIITGNHFYDVGRALFTRYSADHIFSNNYVENVDAAAIFVYRSRTDLTSGYTVNLRVTNNTFRDINNQIVAGASYASSNAIIEIGADATYPVSGILVAHNINKLENTAATYGYILYEFNGSHNPLDESTQTFASGYVTDIRFIGNDFDSAINTSGLHNLSVVPTLIIDDNYGSDQRTAASTAYVHKFYNTTTTGDTKCLLLDKGSSTESTSSTWLELQQNGSSIGGLYNNFGTPALFATSDERLKTNITPTVVGLNDLMQLQVRDFTWKDSGVDTTGFIAQEVMKVYPQAASMGGDDPAINPWRITPTALIPLLVQSIQDLKEELDTVKSKVGG